MLGLRDVMDEPGALEPSGSARTSLPALRDLYDEIWVYGLPQICDPLAGIDAAARACASKMVYTGYLRRDAAAHGADAAQLEDLPDGRSSWSPPAAAATATALIDWVLRAYEHDPGSLPYRRCSCSARSCCPSARPSSPRAPRGSQACDASPSTRSSRALMARAAGVVAMGGYNTFCEILSFDKPALIVPRTTPRLEQFIRAQRAAELGLVAMLPDDDSRDPRDDGGGAAPAAAAAAPVGGRRARACSTAWQRQPAGAQWLAAAAPARWRAARARRRCARHA